MREDYQFGVLPPRNKKVFIKSKTRETATKVSEFRDNRSGVLLNKTKMGDCKDTLRALYSPSLGRLKTGLDKYIDNPYFEKGDELTPEFKYLAKEKKATLQEVYEVMFNRKKGFYTSRPPFKGESQLSSSEIPFFHKFGFKLSDGSTMLDLNLHDDLMAYHIALESKFIANSEKELRENRYPYAKFYISIENESEDIKMKRDVAINKAISNLHDDMVSPEIQKKMVKALNLATGVVSDSKAYNLLSNFIKSERTTNKGVSYTLFNDLYTLLKTDVGRIELDARALLKDLIDSRIIGIKAGNYTWYSKGLKLANRESEMIEFLTDPSKQPELEDLKDEMKLKLSYLN